MAIIKRKIVAERRRAVVFSNAATESGTSEAGNDDVENNRDKSAQQSVTNSYIISAIPYMPKPVASLCLVLNILVPGSGILVLGCWFMHCSI